MSRISNYLKKENVIILESRDKKSVIKELLDNIDTNGNIKNKEKCLFDLNEREKLGTTCIAQYYAIPHAKTNQTITMQVAVGISNEGICYDEEQGKKVHIFFMFLSPVDKSSEYLSLLANLARMIKNNETLKDDLLQLADSEKILEYIKEKEAEL